MKGFPLYLISNMLLEHQIISVASRRMAASVQAAFIALVLAAHVRTMSALPFQPPIGPQPYFAICTIVKNQHNDLCEWLQYHHTVLKVERFYIWDHNSDPPMHDLIARCVPEHTVVYRYLQQVPHTHSPLAHYPQLWAYNRCLQEFGSLHKFMAFIDVDEFINMSGEEKDLMRFLQDFEPYGCLAVNWRVFGSAGHEKRPAGGIMENYNRCTSGQEQGRHTKCIVNTAHTEHAWNPHAFNFKEHYHCVDENKNRVHIPYSATYSDKKIILNHYVLKSRQDYRAKQARGSAMGNHKKNEFFDLTDTAANLWCNQSVEAGRKVIEGVKKVQGNPAAPLSEDERARWEDIKRQHMARLFPPNEALPPHMHGRRLMSKRMLYTFRSLPVFEEHALVRVMKKEQAVVRRKQL